MAKKMQELGWNQTKLLVSAQSSPVLKQYYTCIACLQENQFTKLLSTIDILELIQKSQNFVAA